MFIFTIHQQIVAGDELGLPIHLYGPETHITAVVPLALGLRDPSAYPGDIPLTLALTTTLNVLMLCPHSPLTNPITSFSQSPLTLLVHYSLRTLRIRCRS